MSLEINLLLSNISLLNVGEIERFESRLTNSPLEKIFEKMLANLVRGGTLEEIERNIGTKKILLLNQYIEEIQCAKEVNKDFNSPFEILFENIDTIQTVRSINTYTIGFFDSLFDFTPISHQIINFQHLLIAGDGALLTANREVLISAIQKCRENKTEKLSEVLKKRGFSTIIDNLNLSEMNLSGLDLSDITFNRCRFFHINLSYSNLSKTCFTHCQFEGVYFGEAHLEDVRFMWSTLNQAMFTSAKLFNVNFQRSCVTECSFEDAHLAHVNFLNLADLTGTHFLNTIIHDCSIVQSNLINTLFYGRLNELNVDDESKQTHKQTLPFCGFICHPYVAGISTPKARNKIANEANLIPIRLNYLPEKVYADELKLEIELELGVMDKTPGFLSIPDQFLKNVKETNDVEEFQQSLQIVNKARTISQHVNAIFIPGGEDLPPSWYNQKAEEHTDWQNDYRRTLLEFALIQEGKEKNIPIMGVCHGFQALCVYHGSPLIQDVPGQKGLQDFTFNRSTKEGRILGGEFSSVVFHHQGVPSTAASDLQLRVSTEHSGLIKAVKHNKGEEEYILGLQMHPEFLGESTAVTWSQTFVDVGLNLFIDRRNAVFWKSFSRAVYKRFLPAV